MEYSIVLRQGAEVSLCDSVFSTQKAIPEMQVCLINDV